jgi:electron transport complex protein RnfG
VSHDHSAPPQGASVTPLPHTLPPPEVKPHKLILTMAGFSAIAGVLIVVAFQSTKPRIEHNRAVVLAAAIDEVLAAPPTVRTVFVYNGALVDSLPAGVDSTGLDRVYLGLDQAGKPRGFAVTAGEPGFADVIDLIFGYDPASRKILGMKVLEEKETPGLGDRIEKDSAFVNGFSGPLAPIKGIKRTTAKTDPHQVDMITGATISSRAVINTINHRLEKVGPLLKGYRYGGSR